MNCRPKAPPPWTLVPGVVAVAALGLILWCAYDAFGLHGFQLRMAVLPAACRSTDLVAAVRHPSP